jgi:hypothetical protein
VSGPVRVGPQGEAQEFSAFLWREQHQVGDIVIMVLCIRLCICFHPGVDVHH